MSTMDSNLLHHPIKFSIKTNDLDKLKKKPDKSFFKIEVNDTEVVDIIAKDQMLNQNNSKELEFPPEDILKKHPFICESLISEKVKKTVKRFHQIELDSDSIKHRKIEEKDQVIIEPETSSTLVIRGLPRSAPPPTVSREQSILQIFSKCKDVITNKLEEKIDLIDRICQNATSEVTLSKDSHKVGIINVSGIKMAVTDEKSFKIKKVDHDKRSNIMKNTNTKEVTIDDKCKNKEEKSTCSKVSNTKHFDKGRDERTHSKTDSNSKKADKYDYNPDKGRTKDTSRRFSHKIHLSPKKTDRYRRTNRDESRRKSRTRSKERRRKSHSKSPRKSRCHDARPDDSKRSRPGRSLQMGPLSLRDEFLLETERGVVNPEEQLEESFDCKVTKVQVKNKRNIAERLQLLFNKTKITEESENAVKLPNEVLKPLVSVAEFNFQPEEPIKVCPYEPICPLQSESSTNQPRPVLKSESSTNESIHVLQSESSTNESIRVLQSESFTNEPISDQINQFPRDKVSFIIPLPKILKSKSIDTESNRWFNSTNEHASITSNAIKSTQDEISHDKKLPQPNNYLDTITEVLPLSIIGPDIDKSEIIKVDHAIKEVEKLTTKKTISRESIEKKDEKKTGDSKMPRKSPSKHISSHDDRTESKSKDRNKNSHKQSQNKEGFKELPSKGTLKESPIKENLKDSQSKESKKEIQCKSNRKESQKKESVKEVQSKESLKETQIKESVKQIQSKESLKETQIKESVIKIQSKESLKETQSKESFKVTQIKESVKEIQSKESLKETQSKESLKETRSKESLKETQSKESLKETQSKDIRKGSHGKGIRRESQSKENRKSLHDIDNSPDKYSVSDKLSLRNRHSSDCDTSLRVPIETVPLSQESQLLSQEAVPVTNKPSSSLDQHLIIVSSEFTSLFKEDQPINSWSQESVQKVPTEESSKNDSSSIGKVSFMISPRKILKTPTAMTMAPKLSLPKTLTTNDLPGNKKVLMESQKIEPPSLVCDSDTCKTSQPQSESNILELESLKDSLHKECSNIVPSREENDLNLFVINQEDRKSDDDKRTMHIEKTVIMEPLTKTCNISFRIKTSEKKPVNIFGDIVNKNLASDPYPVDNKSIYSTVEKSSIEMVESKPRKDHESPMMLSYILDNLTQSHPSDQSKTKEDNGKNILGLQPHKATITDNTSREPEKQSIERVKDILKHSEVKSHRKSTEKTKDSKSVDKSRDKSTDSKKPPNDSKDRHKSKDGKRNSSGSSKSKNEIKDSEEPNKQHKTQELILETFKDSVECLKPENISKVAEKNLEESESKNMDILSIWKSVEDITTNEGVYEVKTESLCRKIEDKMMTIEPSKSRNTTELTKIDEKDWELNQFPAKIIKWKNAFKLSSLKAKEQIEGDIREVQESKNMITKEKSPVDVEMPKNDSQNAIVEENSLQLVQPLSKIIEVKSADILPLCKSTDERSMPKVECHQKQSEKLLPEFSTLKLVEKTKTESIKSIFDEETKIKSLKLKSDENDVPKMEGNPITESIDSRFKERMISESICLKTEDKLPKETSNQNFEVLSLDNAEKTYEKNIDRKSLTSKSKEVNNDENNQISEDKSCNLKNLKETLCESRFQIDCTMIKESKIPASTRKYRQQCYRNRSRRSSKSDSKSSEDSLKSARINKRANDNSSPRRNYRRPSEHRRSRQRSRDIERSRRSRSIYSRKRQYTSRKKSNDTVRRRRDSRDSREKRNYQTSSDRHKSKLSKRTSRSRSNSNWRRKLSKSRSSSRKHVRKQKRSTSKHRRRSHSTSDSFGSRHKHKKIKSKIREKSPKRCHNDRKSKEKVLSKKLRKSRDRSKSREKGTRSKSRDNIQSMALSKSLDKQQTDIKAAIEPSLSSPVEDNTKSLVDDKSQSSNADDKSVPCDTDTEANKTKTMGVENIIEEKIDLVAVKENVQINRSMTETTKAESEVKIVIKERTCAENCMLNFLNRHIPNIVEIKKPTQEIPNVYKTEVTGNQLVNQNYYQHQSSNITNSDASSNLNYYMSSQQYHQSQQSVYPTACGANFVHHSYSSSQSHYQPSSYPSFYPPQPPTQLYQSQPHDNYFQNYPKTTTPLTSYPTLTPHNSTSTQHTSNWNTYEPTLKEYDTSTFETPTWNAYESKLKKYDASTFETPTWNTYEPKLKEYDTSSFETPTWNAYESKLKKYDASTFETQPPPPPPPPPTTPFVNQLDIPESKPTEEVSFCRTRNSSTSSLSISVVDMDIVSPSFKSIDSNVGLKLGDEVSNNDDDLSSCEEFQYDDVEPQDPFQKYADAPRPEYEHIIKTEVHVSAVGKRFEYAYLKSTSCNCIPPNPDEIRLGKAACDEHCFNRQIKVECNRNCPVYELCTNRRFQEQIYSPIEPFYSGSGKGWGIRALSSIQSGTFVIEYVGELIDSEEFFKRINQTATHHHHFMMIIQKDMYIDAGNKGNWARFVNHSCDPNTVIERWVVNGKTRIGFFSKKPILKDEEITIDYQFQQYGSDEQKCYCASANCTGIMGKVNEKLQEQFKMSAIRHRKELIQRIISRKSLKEISNVSEMITVIKENNLDRDTFFSFLEVLQRTASHVCIRTFIECGGLNVITTYLDTISWNDWPLKLLYLQCLDHFKLRKRTLISSGYTSATVVEYWSDNPRYETKHVVDDSLNIDLYNDDSETVSDSLEPSPPSNESPIQFSLPITDEVIIEIEKQVQSLALKIKEYFYKEKEKFFIPKIKGNTIEFSNELSTNDSESKSISIASSIQGDFVQMKTRKLRNKCNEVIQKLPKEEFRRLFSERYYKSLIERKEFSAPLESNDNGKYSEVFQDMKQVISSVIIEEINNLKQNEQLSSMPIEFQNADIDKILSSLNIVEKESLLSLVTPQQDDSHKLGSLSNYSKSSDETSKGDQDIPPVNIEQLPPNWRFCRCENGRIYFYHTISKKTQWETPIYPWDAGDDDPSAYDFGDAHNYPVSVEDCKNMLAQYRINHREEKIQERQKRRMERTLQRRLSLSAGERNKINFSREVFKAVKVQMKPYFSSSCKIGRVRLKADLKFLCEKFADTIIGKEVKSVTSLEDLELNSDVSAKMASYITKYMSNQGRFFKRSTKPKVKPSQTSNSKADSVGSGTPNFSF